MINQSCDGLRPAVHDRRRHHRAALGNFFVLGFHVGVWTVQLASLAAALRLDPQSLGTAITAASAAGVLTLLVGGHLADRLGRRPVLCTGFASTAAAFTWLARVHSLSGLVAAVVLYGVSVSFIDLGANAVGSDYERFNGVRAMTGLHARFSLGAVLGAVGTGVALWSGAGFRAVYAGLAVILAAAALRTAVAALPPGTAAAVASPQRRPGPTALRIPAVAFAVALVVMTFFGDGGLESFLAVYLRTTLGSTVLLTSAGIGSYHVASMAGRLLASRVLGRWPERVTVPAAGLLAAAGVTVAISAPSAGIAIGGLLLVGLAVAPIVPSALSLAGRSAPGRSAQAVAATTAAGYSAFVISPILIGTIASRTSLRAGLAVLIVTALGSAALALRWPARDGPDRAR
jgi:MFS family permease